MRKPTPWGPVFKEIWESLEDSPLLMYTFLFGFLLVIYVILCLP